MTGAMASITLQHPVPGSSPGRSIAARRWLASLLLRYAFAVAVIALSIVLKMVGAAWLPKDADALFFAAVSLVAWRSGRGPGLVAVALSALAQTYFFLLPIHSFAITALDEVLSLAAWCVEGVIACFLFGALDAAKRSLDLGIARRTKELGEKTALLESILASMADSVIVVDDVGTLVLANPAALSFAGTEPDMSLSEWYNTHEVLLSDQTTPVTPADMPLARVLRGEAEADAELFIRTAAAPDGVFQAVAARPLLGEDGRLRGAVLVGHDVTARRTYEIERERARAAAEAATRAKSEFLANMSHEIRTPMAAVLGYADLLLDHSLGVHERLGHAQTIRRNGEHLLTLLDDILDLSKIEAGKATVESIPCSPSRIVVDVASLMRVRAVEKKLWLEIDYLTPVPETICGDPTRLRQILTNLVGNAVKFTAAGGVRVLVRCDGRDSPRPCISFCIADTGIGLTAEQIDGLFNPFTQADSSTTRRFGGTGLGLTICQRFAKMLGGYITVESVPGQGSAFTLTVETGPLDGVPMCSDIEEAGPSEPPVRAKLPLQLSGLRVLLAEDGVDNQRLLSALLRQTGAQVTVADNGRIAVDYALSALTAGEPFDVILMDMQMPELDGYGATASLRARAYERPIVALTAHAMAEDRARCLAAGCDDYLTKPVDKTSLYATVRRAAAGWHDRHDEPLASPSPSLDDVVHSELAGDPEMQELVDDYVATMPGRTEALWSAVASFDREAIGYIAHQIKGSAGSYGFMSITDAAAALEGVAHAGESADITRRVSELTSLCARARGHTP
jgi:signal transduction histidine kinase/DNA-binding response OmpR family regulator